MSDIPTGWELAPLHSLIAQLESGTSVNSEDRLKQNGEIGVLKVSAVSYGVFKPDEHKTVLESEYSNVKTNPRRDRVIISRANTWELVGASAYVEQDYPDLYLSDKLWQTRQKTEHSVRWLSYVLQLSHTRFEISSRASGTSAGMKNISKEAFLGIEILVPPLAEQRTIANILHTWDEAIALTEALIAALQQRKKGLMHKLLTGEVRFPEFNGEWQLVNLGKLATVKRGASPRPIQDPKWFSASGRGWIRIADINASSSRFLVETTQYLSDLGVERSVPVEVGELILSIAATIGVPKVVNIPACIHDGFVLLKDYENEFERDFLYHFLSMLTPKLSGRGQPGTQKNINSEIVRRIQIPKITKQEQRKIADVLNDGEEEIQYMLSMRDKLQQQKKGLMQQLLTGQVRVNVEEE